MAPATALALSGLRMNNIRKFRNFTNILWGPSLNPPFSSWHCEVVSSLVFKISLRNLAIFPFLYAPLAVVTVFFVNRSLSQVEKTTVKGLYCHVSMQWSCLKCYYDQNLMSSLSQKRFLFSLSEVTVPVSVIEMKFGALLDVTRRYMGSNCFKMLCFVNLKYR